MGGTNIPVRSAVVLVLLALLLAPGAGAQSPRPSALVLDAASGRVLARIAVDDLITAAVPDGRGGWYVGGFFTRIGGKPRTRLAHLLPDGSVDPRFRIAVGRRGDRSWVRALTRRGRVLYVGCACRLVGGRYRPGLVAIDLRTQRVLDAFEPGLWIDVDRLATTRERLLVARNDNYPVPGITALDLRTGAVERGWNAGFRLIGDAGTFSTVVPKGRRVFVAGAFRVTGFRRNGLVALDAATGAVDRAWAPKPPDCPVCIGFASLSGLAVSDERVYVSGSFTRLGGLPRNGVVALDPRTGAVDRSWRPARGSQTILTLALAAGRLYLGTGTGLLALDARTGAAAHAPKLPFREVFPLSASGGRLLVGGR